jgi:hypothetical protein
MVTIGYAFGFALSRYYWLKTVRFTISCGGWLFFKVSCGILEGPVEIWGIKFESARRNLGDYF